MSNSPRIEIDWFMVFLICIFVVLPLGKALINKLPGGEEDVVKKTQKVVVEVEDTQEDIYAPTGSLRDYSTITLSERIASATLNNGVKFKVQDDIVKVIAKSPSEKESRLEIKNKTSYLMLNEEGLWGIETFDNNGLLKGWYRISVY